MDIKPLKQYHRASYPTRTIIDEHPELLRLLPNRWQRSAIVGAALAAACGIIAVRWSTTTVQAAGEPVSKVAPIFQHGDGQGSFGCVAAAPPVFLSEDEARAVIVSEAKLAGLQFQPDAQTLDNIDLPISRMFGFIEEVKAKPKTQPGTLLLDGVDTQKHVAYEYVSESDFYTWREQDEGMAATAWEVNLHESATILQQSLSKAKPTGVYGVFYDPVAKEQRWTDRTKTAVLTDQTLVPLTFFANWGDPGAPLKIQSGRGDMIFVIWGKDHSSVMLDFGKTTARVGGKTEQLPAPVMLRNNVAYVPLKWAVQTFGGTFEWDERNHQVTVHAPGLDYPMRGTVVTMPIEGMKTPGTAAFTEYDRQNIELEARNTAREELREQVRDFVKWLKAEGVI